MIIAMVGLTFAASAQKFYAAHHYSRPRVMVSAGVYSPFYPYGYLGPYYPYPNTTYPVMPTRLEIKIDNIRNDYSDRIWSARHDKTISRTERRATILKLKHERDQAILDTKSNYYKTKK